MKDRLSRRDLLALAATSGAALALPSWARAVEAAPAKKKLLILGGTRFLGPALVDAAMAKGWSLTLFNRGKSNPGLFKDKPLEEIHGDRNIADDVKKLAGRKWDAVIDTSGYFPRQVRSAAEVLARNVGQYVFISSISVYSSPMKAGMDETAAVMRLPDGTDVDAIKDIGEGNYGALKYLCEEAAETAMPGRTLNIRPGYIVGVRDGSRRVANPGDATDPVGPLQPIATVLGKDDRPARDGGPGREGRGDRTGPRLPRPPSG